MVVSCRPRCLWKATYEVTTYRTWCSKSGLALLLTYKDIGQISVTCLAVVLWAWARAASRVKLL